MSCATSCHLSEEKLCSPTDTLSPCSRQPKSLSEKHPCNSLYLFNHYFQHHSYSVTLQRLCSDRDISWRKLCLMKENMQQNRQLTSHSSFTWRRLHRWARCESAEAAVKPSKTEKQISPHSRVMGPEGAPGSLKKQLSYQSYRAHCEKNLRAPFPTLSTFQCCYIALPG